MVTKPRILYEKGVIKKIANRFGVTEATVRLALRFVIEGEQPDLIRKAALSEMGVCCKRIPTMQSTEFKIDATTTSEIKQQLDELSEEE